MMNTHEQSIWSVLLVVLLSSTKSLPRIFQGPPFILKTQVAM